MINYIKVLFISCIISCSLSANAKEIDISDIEEERIISVKILQGDEAKAACEKQISKNNSNAQFIAVRECMAKGTKVADKDSTYKNVSRFCEDWGNQSKYGFTNDGKCRRKIIEIINNNWTLQ
jgi:hypothetical protein